MFKLIATTLNQLTKTITLTAQHLPQKTIDKISSGDLTPHSVSLRHFVAEVRNTLCERSLNRTRAKVIFYYKGKNYLIIYNK